MHAISAIRAEGLACVRGGREVFVGVGLAVEAGALLVIEGANGAGKTSLLRMLAGFIPPAAGQIIVEGAEGTIGDSEDRAKLIGWLGHSDAAKPQLTPLEVFSFFARLYGSAAPASGLLREIGLERAAGLPCLYLSAGQKKRLALARLKLTARPIWLLDEPLASLDEEGKSLVLRFLNEHCHEGGMAIVASHEPVAPEAARLRLG